MKKIILLISLFLYTITAQASFLEASREYSNTQKQEVKKKIHEIFQLCDFLKMLFFG